MTPYPSDAEAWADWSSDSLLEAAEWNEECCRHLACGGDCRASDTARRMRAEVERRAAEQVGTSS